MKYKKFLIAKGLMLLFTVCMGLFLSVPLAHAQNKGKTKQKKYKEVVFKLDSIKDKDDAVKIVETLQCVDGVSQVQVFMSKSEISVEYDAGKASVFKLTSALELLGKTVSEK